MKKAKTFLLLGITLCMFGCSDDDDDKSNTTSTVPFSLTASLEVRNDAATTPGMLQGNWNEGTKLAAMHSSLTGVKKVSSPCHPLLPTCLPETSRIK